MTPVLVAIVSVEVLVPVKGAEVVEFSAPVEAAVSVPEETELLLAEELALPLLLLAEVLPPVDTTASLSMQETSEPD